MALLPGADLLTMLRLLCRPGLRGVLADPDLPAGEARRQALRLSMPPTARRPLHPLLRPGAPLHHLEVDGYPAKAAVVAAVCLLAAAAGLRRRAQEALEQALEELLLNALLDAPRGEHGGPRYLGCPTEERVKVHLPAGERPQVLCGGDKERYAVGVRDRFGALRRGTVIACLRRCAEAQVQRRDPLEHGPGGAGVGLFLAASSSSELLFRLRRGRLSEVVCAVSARPGPQVLRALYIDDDGGDGADGEGPGSDDGIGPAGGGP